MNIIGISGNETSGILESLREENEARQRAELVSAYAGGWKEKAPARQSGLSDTVFISDAAMLLSMGVLDPDAVPLEGEDGESFRTGDQDTGNAYTYAGKNALAQARTSARRARIASTTASLALLAPLPPGGEGSNGSDDKVQKREHAASETDAAFSVARLQSRLRDLQQELSVLEGGASPDQIKTEQIHALNSRINQAMQELSGQVQRGRK